MSHDSAAPHQGERVSHWLEVDPGGAICRVREGGDVNNVGHRVALIEKTPRVRIRRDFLEVERPHLNWCEGLKGSGPLDDASMAWCDAMLVALGYTLPED